MVRLAICEENDYFLCVRTSLPQYAAHVIHSIVCTSRTAILQPVHSSFHLSRNCVVHERQIVSSRGTICIGNNSQAMLVCGLCDLLVCLRRPINEGIDCILERR